MPLSAWLPQRLLRQLFHKHKLVVSESVFLIVHIVAAVSENHYFRHNQGIDLSQVFLSFPYRSWLYTSMPISGLDDIFYTVPCTSCQSGRIVRDGRSLPVRFCPVSAAGHILPCGGTAVIAEKAAYVIRGRDFVAPDCQYATRT